MLDDPDRGFEDVDRDGIPDMLDIQVDPPPIEFAPPLSEPLTDEERLEMQRHADELNKMNQTLTNIQQTRHEALKDIADNLRG
jgi:hypothetical protein